MKGNAILADIGFELYSLRVALEIRADHFILSNGNGLDLEDYFYEIVDKFDFLSELVEENQDILYE